ncbi:iron sulfur cluster assembly protein 2, mitochondrial [Coccidioides immitis RS]|uniref:Iron-sulfur cluster assembly protein n=3 Tax=Coccidioides immitis TaxID=5501 RepID=J3KD39_COCIM|nr:iron sulfur cluster assembly protein 2, mitochondrial [Coccidioides immitis RS]EAS33221.3 iron sulfur cluster assembly protein 2, mitochondrial [Coccidioides immitis RS]KMP08520.1 iron sulfur cluster assembly protein 1 [Coccidioides immitis RMSCC 2394]KMU82102.1 iron sulfur cluster assembly protein 1 [Coccidioides immitis RMSCC 3703]
MFRRAITTISRSAAGQLSRRPIRPTVASKTFAPIIFQQISRSYHEKVLDHYSNPRNVGSMPKTDQDVGTGLVGAPACGDVMKLQIRVDKNSNTISDVKFKTFGCGSAIASSSYLTELVRGMTLEEAAKIRNTEIAKELCLPPVKLHCSMLAEDAIKSAISNYYTKNPKAAPTNLSGTESTVPRVESRPTPSPGSEASS